MKQKRKTIGILGGMGPEASAYMYKLLIGFSIKYFAAQNNDDFPEIVLYSIPVPDFISNKKNEKIALEMLKDGVRKLNHIDVSFLAIACNTVHILLPDLEKISKKSFISMIDEVVKKVKQSKIKKVGILGTPSTINSKLYQKALFKYKIESIVPNNRQQILLDKIIRNVLAGKIREKDKKQLINIADSLKLRGAKGIVLGCTELPLIFPPDYLALVYNSVAVLSMALLRKYYE
jgi:aspartate racemase